MIDLKYKAQVDLLLQTIPFIAKERIFALKGGTAINLFVWDMPRLSVDIDLTYLSFDDRESALKNISEGLARIKSDLEQSIPNISVTAASRDGQDVKINCQLPGAQIKIEVNTTTRGSIRPTRLMRVRDTVEDAFGKFAAIHVVSHGELYGGKVCAALDRQHPRDLFDIKLLLDKEGFSDEIKEGFLVALISHMRPISDVISPNLIDQRQAFETQFSGMTNLPFSYDDYERTRVQLVGEIHSKLTADDRFFLMSFKQGNPDWSKLSIENAKLLPAVQWKLQNIEKLIRDNPEKHKLLVKALEEKLFIF
jgi:predicted nucleotidyltransferase component of viral defense system